MRDFDDRPCKFRLLHITDSPGIDGNCPECKKLTNEDLKPFRIQAARWHKLSPFKDGSFPDEVVQEFVLHIGEKNLSEKHDPTRKRRPFCHGINKQVIRKMTRTGRCNKHLGDAQWDLPERESSTIDVNQGELDKPRHAESFNACLAKLPSRYRQAICSAYGIDDPCGEIRIIPTTADKSWVLSRARKRMRQLMKAMCEKQDPRSR